jgi:hypothetical protein
VREDEDMMFENFCFRCRSMDEDKCSTVLLLRYSSHK